MLMFITIASFCQVLSKSQCGQGAAPRDAKDYGSGSTCSLVSDALGHDSADMQNFSRFRTTSACFLARNFIKSTADQKKELQAVKATNNDLKFVAFLRIRDSDADRRPDRKVPVRQGSNLGGAAEFLQVAPNIVEVVRRPHHRRPRARVPVQEERVAIPFYGRQRARFVVHAGSTVYWRGTAKGHLPTAGGCSV
uniref:RxLR effector candidate protein n=1 Tax=Hyaloperonospora arabidopsidis (strain Emoy2) TaxID=559515 RepID=M4BHY7_HYAAE